MCVFQGIRVTRLLKGNTEKKAIGKILGKSVYIKNNPTLPNLIKEDKFNTKVTNIIM